MRRAAKIKELLGPNPKQRLRASGGLGELGGGLGGG